MTEYETIYITPGDAESASLTSLNDKIKAICSKDGASLLRFKDWGVRKMAYEIAKTRRGHYFFINYLTDQSAVVPELERNLRFDEKVIRFHTVKVGKVDDVKARLKEVKSLETTEAKQQTKDTSAPAESESEAADKA